MRGDVFVGKVQDQNAAEMKANYGELSLQLRTAKSPYGDGFAEARIRYGLQGALPGTFIDLREAYVNTYLGPFDLRLGKQIIVWGRADALNPTNNLTPVDFRIRSPLEDDIRLGNIGARAFLRLSPVRLEGVWMPTYLATELPNVGLPPLVAFGPPRFPSAELRNGLVAGRRAPGAARVRDLGLVPARLRAAARPDAVRRDLRRRQPGRPRIEDRLRPAGARASTSRPRSARC